MFDKSVLFLAKVMCLVFCTLCTNLDRSVLFFEPCFSTFWCPVTSYSVLWFLSGCFHFCIMNHFPQPPLDSIGGLDKFYFVPVEGVVSIPLVINHNIATPLSFGTGYTWLIGYGSFDTLEFSERSKLTNQGRHIEATLKGFVPESPEMLKQLEQMDGRRFILRITDNDNMVRICGTLTESLAFTTDFETQTVSGVKGYHFQVSGFLRKRSPIYLPPAGASSSQSSQSSQN